MDWRMSRVTIGVTLWLLGACDDAPADAPAGGGGATGCTAERCPAWSLTLPVRGNELHLDARGGRVMLALNGPFPAELGNGLQIPGSPTDNLRVAIVGIDPSRRQADWVQVISPSPDAELRELRNVDAALDGQGRTIVSATFAGSLMLGDTLLASATPDDGTDGVVLQLAADGAERWHYRFGLSRANPQQGIGNDVATGVSVTTSDDVWVTGVIATEVPGIPELFVPLYVNRRLAASDGALLASADEVPASPPASYKSILRVAGSGDRLVVSGYLRGVCGAAESSEYHVVQLAPSCVARDLPYRPEALVFDAEGNLYVHGSDPPWIAKLDPSLSAIWSMRAPFVGQLAVSPDGEAYLFGADPGLRLAHFTTGGDLVETLKLGGGTPGDIAIDEAGTIYLAGRLGRDFKLATEPLPSDAGGVFVVALER